MQEENFQIIRSPRRTVALEIKRDGTVLVRAPLQMTESAIDAFVTNHQDWLEKHLAQVALKEPPRTYTEAEIQTMKAQAKITLPERVAYYSQKMGLVPTGVKITSARTRFGSCNSKNSLCFSWQLMAYPLEAIDYVVVHELAHISHKNHGSAFYALIASYLPDYRRRAQLLRQIPIAMEEKNTK